MPSKPRRRRSSSKRDLEARPIKSLARHGVNFFAMLLGLVAATLILFLIWNFLTSSPNETQVGDTNNESQLGKLAANTSDDEFENLLGNGKEQLNRLLDAFNRRAQDPETANDVKTHKRRLAVIDQLLAERLDSKENYNVVAAKFDSMTKLLELNQQYNLEDPSFEINLREAGKVYSSDQDRRIAILARVTLIELDAFKNAEIKLVARSMYQLASEFPDEPAVLAGLRTIVARLIDVPADREKGVKLAQAVLDQTKPREFVEHRDLSNVLQEYQDWCTLKEKGFYSAWEARSFSGPTGYNQMMEIALSLCEEKSGGRQLLTHLDKIAYWFEQGNEYDFALPIYQALLENADAFELPSVSESANTLATYGIKRCELVGQPFFIRGQTVAGESVNQFDFENRIVVVMYFSLADADSVNSMGNVQNERSTWESRSVRSIAVCTDKRDDRVFDETRLEKIGSMLDGWTIVVRDDKNRLPIFDQCPSLLTSRAILLDKNHRVSDVDVIPSELRAQISFVLISGSN
ncbi:MAG: hypothetical protein AAFN77_08090 [Planctomycetota bacterium]